MTTTPDPLAAAAAAAAALDASNRILQNSRDLREVQEAQYAQAIANAEALGVAGAEMKKMAETQRDMANNWDDIFGAMTGVSDEWKQSTWYQMSQPGALSGMVDSFNRTFTAANIAHSSIAKVVQASIALTYQQQDVEVEFNKATGGARKYGDQLFALETSMYHHGVGLAESQAAMTGLMGEMKQFNNLSNVEQTELAETTGLLEHMGVSSTTTAANMHFLSAAMGMTAQESAKTQRQLFVLAQDIGQAPAAMAEDFQAAAPQMAKFGKEGTEVFKKLAVNAKHAGMEVSQLLSITEKFDTFAGAAESVGHLNAVLGGPYLSSLQMVEATDPTERMRLLSKAVGDAGASFDDMSYYQRKTLTEAMGLSDVSELALVMRDGFDATVPAVASTQSELAELAEQSRDFNTLADEMAQLVRSIAIGFLPLIKALKTGIQWIQDLNDATGKWLIPTMMGLVIAVSLGVAALTALAGALLGAGAAAAALNSVMSLFGGGGGGGGGSGGTIETVTTGIASVARSAAEAAVSIIAFGAAILLAGVGIAVAATGLALLVVSFSALTGQQMVAALAAIILLSLTFVGFSLILASLVKSGALEGAESGLLALGAAFLMVGIGIAFAAAGVGAMTYAFSLLVVAVSALFQALDTDKLTIFVSSLTTLGLSIANLAIAVPVLAALGTGLVAFAYALSFIDTENIDVLSKFFTSLGTVLDKDLEKLTQMEAAVKGIVAAANGADDAEKLIQVRQIIEAVNGAASASTQSTISATSAANSPSPAAGNTLNKPLHVSMVMNGREMFSWAEGTVSDFLNLNKNA